MQKLNASIKFMVMEFLPKVLMEFIWLLFSVGMGMAIVAGVTDTDLEPILDAFAVPITTVVFIAAASRYVIAYGLERIDKDLDKIAAQQANEMSLIKTGVQMSVRMLLGKKVTTEGQDEKPAQ